MYRWKNLSVLYWNGKFFSEEKCAARGWMWSSVAIDMQFRRELCLCNKEEGIPIPNGFFGNITLFIVFAASQLGIIMGAIESGIKRVQNEFWTFRKNLIVANESRKRQERNEFFAKEKHQQINSKIPENRLRMPLKIGVCVIIFPASFCCSTKNMLLLLLLLFFPMFTS